MKHISIYILPLVLLFLSACQGNEIEPTSGHGTLVLDLYRGAIPTAQTRAGVDEGLALRITRQDGQNFADGRQYIAYAAGEAPRKIVLEEGTFNIYVYSQNQGTWRTDNNGLGSACYEGSTEVTISADDITYCEYAAPMTNYAVTLTLPELFHDLFSSYDFTVKSGNRSISLREGQKAYFSPNDAGFTYQLSATNIDGDKHSASAILYTNVQKGKLYNLRYQYSNSSNTGGIDIDITDNTTTEDTEVNL